MAIRHLQNPGGLKRDRANFIIPIVVLWVVVAAAVLSFVWIDNDMSTLMPELYLLPWTILAGICVLAPSVYLFYKGRFDLFHPLVFAAWSHVFPAYVLGGVIVAFGSVNTYFLPFFDDPKYNLPLTLFYIAIGFVGMTVGFFLPLGRIVSDVIEPRLPKWNWKPEQVWIPGLALLVAGVAFNVLGFIQGLLGFQRNIEVGIFDGLLFGLITLLGEGTLLLWLAIFSAKEKGAIYYLVLAVLVLFLPVRMAVIGSRSSLILGLLPIAMAFLYSGRKLKLRTAVVFGVIGLIAVF